jgi:hypothetical protein
LSECSEFGKLPVAGRRQAVGDQGLCKCCLTDCEGKEAGTRCYQQDRPWQHQLLQVAAEEEVVLTGRAKWKGGRSPSRAGKGCRFRDTPPEKVRRLNSAEQGRNRKREATLPRQVAT